MIANLKTTPCSTAELHGLLEDALPFIASTVATNPHPGGKLNAHKLCLRIQKALGKEPMPILTDEEYFRLKEICKGLLNDMH